MLRHQADIRSLAFVGLGLGLLLVAHVVSPIQLGGGVLAACWIICATVLCFAASIINHNHQHCRVFRSKRWNVGFDIVLSLLRGHTATGVIVPHHLNHHVEAGSDKDWIRPALGGAGPGWLRLPRFILVSTVTMMIERNRPGAPVLGARHQKKWKVEKVFLYLAVGSLALHDWRVFLLYNVVPWLSGLVLLVGVNLLQHDACLPQTPWGESRNFTGGLANWLFFNNGFHTAHHAKPGLHWSELPALHAGLREKLPHPDLEHDSILLYLWRFCWMHNPSSLDRSRSKFN